MDFVHNIFSVMSVPIYRTQKSQKETNSYLESFYTKIAQNLASFLGLYFSVSTHAQWVCDENIQQSE